MTKCQHERHRGWTLVELMVAIAIISIVAALLTAAFKSALWFAKVSTCTQDLSSIGKAYDLYTADNGGLLPPYFDDASSSDHPDQSKELVLTMARYGVDKRQFFCPLDKYMGRFDQEGNFDHTYKSYAYSIGFKTLSPPDQKWLKINIDGLSSPSRTDILMDAFVVDGRPENVPMTGHGKWVNILFGDWHVKQVTTVGFDFGCTYPGQTKACQ